MGSPERPFVPRFNPPESVIILISLPDVLSTLYAWKVIPAVLVQRNWIYNRPKPKKDFVNVKSENRSFKLSPLVRVGFVHFKYLGELYTAYVPYSLIFKEAIGGAQVNNYLEYVKTSNVELIPVDSAEAESFKEVIRQIKLGMTRCAEPRCAVKKCPTLVQQRALKRSPGNLPVKRSGRYLPGLKANKDEPSDGEQDFPYYMWFINQKEVTGSRKRNAASQDICDLNDASLDNRDDDVSAESKPENDAEILDNIEEQLLGAEQVEPPRIQIAPQAIPAVEEPDQQDCLNTPNEELVLEKRTCNPEPMAIKEYLSIQFARFKEAQTSALSQLKEQFGQKQFDELVATEYTRMTDRFHDPDYYSRSFPSFLLFQSANIEIGKAKIPSADWTSPGSVKISSDLMDILSECSLPIQSVIKTAATFSKSRRNPQSTQLTQIDLRYVCFMHDYPLKLLVSLFNFSQQTLDKHYQRCHGYFNSWYSCPVVRDENGENCKFQNFQHIKVTDHLRNVHGISDFPDQVKKPTKTVNRWFFEAERQISSNFQKPGIVANSEKRSERITVGRDHDSYSYTKVDPDRVKSKEAIFTKITMYHNRVPQPACSKPEGTGTHNWRKQKEPAPSETDSGSSASNSGSKSGSDSGSTDQHSSPKRKKGKLSK